jgi:phage/plasmid-like protein (TIGR03299 family)
MPHEFVSGVFGASRPAWHGLGEVREGLLTTDQALTLSGVAEVEASPEPIYARDRHGEYHEIPGWLAVTRTSNGDVLGVHSGTYAVENFVDAFRALGFADDAKVWETMILLRGGRIAAGVLRLPDLDRILPDDSTLAAYVAAYTSHDGSYALTYKDSHIRIECANRLRLADSENAGRTIRIAHRPGKDERRAEAARIITYAQERADAQERQATVLLQTQIDGRRAEAIVAELLPLPEANGTPRRRQAIERQQANRERVLRIFRNAPDLADVRGTAWGFVQAVGAYVDHEARYRRSQDTTPQERRFIRTVLNADTIAERALQLVAGAVPGGAME